MSAIEENEPTRRDFLYIATGAAAAVGVAGVVWPLVNQLAPNAAEEAAGQPIELDVSAIEEGQSVTVTWRGKPYFVRHLSEGTIEELEATPASEYKDPADIKARLAKADPEAEIGTWTIVAANCTHLGCVPTKVEEGIKGWACPCHGSVFDAAGRIMSGPAPINLPVPPYYFASAETLVIGTEKAGA